MQKELDALVRVVAPLDRSAMTAAEAYQARLAKPPGSLGRLEEISIQLAGITGRVHNALNKKQLLVFAADNGVVAEGVSSAPQSVTKQQTINLMRGKTGAAVLAKHFGCGLTVCDVGVNADIYESTVLNRKIAYGTQNICTGPGDDAGANLTGHPDRRRDREDGRRGRDRCRRNGHRQHDDLFGGAGRAAGSGRRGRDGPRRRYHGGELSQKESGHPHRPLR